MADVVYQDPIEHLSGKISKKYRTCYNYRKVSKRKYTSVPGERTTPPTTSEIINRTRFSEIARAVQARMHDLSKISRDQQAFLAQRETGYKTMQSYIWHLEADAYDEANS